jgi:hypothetical protein
MHSYMIHKVPTNASKYQCISTLVHSYLFQRFKAPSSGPAELLPKVVKAEQDDGCILYTVVYSPHTVLLSRLWATIQQADAELPEDGAFKR